MNVRYNVFYLSRFLTAAWVCVFLCGLFTAAYAQEGQWKPLLISDTEEKENWKAPAEIYDIVVSPVYVPYEEDNPEKGKYVVVFDSDKTELHPADIERIVVTGPDSFRLEILDQSYGPPAYNGYLYDQANNMLWYQAYTNGFPGNGRYAVVVFFNGGGGVWKARTLEKNHALLDAYRSCRKDVSFYPAEGQALPGSQVLLMWTPLNRIGGPDAYYNCWIRTNGVAASDMIFRRSETEPLAGFNNSWSPKGVPQKPLPAGEYSWFVEIVDSNVFSEINMVIFQPWQDIVVY